MWHSFRPRSRAGALLIAVALLLTGCVVESTKSGDAVVAQDPPKTAVPAPAHSVIEISPIPQEQLELLTLYYPHQSRPVLVLEERATVRRGHQPEMLILMELLKGPPPPQARAVMEVNPSVPLNGVKTLNQETIVVMTPQEAEALRKGGLLSVYSIVNSLAAGKRVKQVRFMIIGHSGSIMVDRLDITGLIEPRWDLVEHP